MPDDDDRDSQEQRRRWAKLRTNTVALFSRAKSIFLKKPRINAIGQNANFPQQHFTAGGDQYISFAGPNASFLERSASDQRGRRPMPATQDSHGSRDEATQTALVQEPPRPEQLQTNNNLPTLIPPDSDNAHSEPEATAIYTVPELPSDSMTTFSPASRPRFHIYYLEMLTLGEGYPLYMPTPPDGLPLSHRENGVRVGDVGVITGNGAFHFLFNVFEENDRPIESTILTSKKFGPKAFLSSICVNDTGESSHPTFQCSADEGALLALPKGATVYEAGNRANFLAHVSRYALSWYEYVLNRGVHICNGSLYFVTECTKCMDWGIAVFYGPSTANHNLRFISDGESYQWDSRGKVDTRTGSKSTDTTVSDSVVGEPNQCVFLGGFKIMLRSDIWAKLKSATSVASQDGGSSRQQTSRATADSTNYGTSGSTTDPFYQSTSDNRNTPDHSHKRLQANQPTHTTPVLQGVSANAAEITSEPEQLILEEYFGGTAPLHPSDLVNAMLLQLKPEATVAITHDSQWCNHLPDDFNADPTTPNFDSLLQNIEGSYKAVIDKHGSVVLENLESGSEVRATYSYSPDISEPNRKASTSNITSSQTSTPPREAPVQAADGSEDYPRFRILIVGQQGAGKSSLINAIFKAPLAEVQPEKTGTANINDGIILPQSNKHLILRDSEPEDVDAFHAPDKFVAEQAQKQSPAERLHAIWFCIPASYSGDPLFEKAEEMIFELSRHKVPMIIVVTKFDLYVAGLQRRSGTKTKISYQLAEDDFKKEFDHTFDKKSMSEGQIPYALVSKKQVDTLKRLVKITRETMRTKNLGPLDGDGHVAGSDELDPPCSAQIALATAQRVEMAVKIEASTKVGKKKYWRVIGTDIYFSAMNLAMCLKVVHKDIVTIWNIRARGLHDYFLGDEFRRQMMAIVEDLQDSTNTMQSKITATSTMASPSKLRTSSVFKERPEDMRYFMGYVVDLTLILQCIFDASLEDQLEGMVTKDSVIESIGEFNRSDKKRIHDAIRKFVEARYPFTKGDLEKEIASLVQREKCGGSK